VPKPVSNHLAAALLVFTLWQMVLLNHVGSGFGLHMAALVTTGLFALFARKMERAWAEHRPRSLQSVLGKRQLLKDMSLVWSIALLAPLLWVPLIAIF
jgi:hypothetical protein